jgi:hypothetical protein
MKVNFHTNGHIFTHLAYFTQIFNTSHIFTQLTIFSHIEHILYNHCATFRCSLGFLEFLIFFIVVIAQVRSFIDRWYSWLDHQDDERMNLIKLIKLFIIDGILDSDDSSFFRYNHLKSFVCCVWNIEHLSNMFC